MLSTVIIVIVLMGIVGLIFGFVLAYANKKFAVEVNPLIHIVEDILPKGQCGSCGYAGCQAYAEAVVMDPNVAPNLCIPGKEPVAKMVSELTGKTAAVVEPKVAQIRCAGTPAKALSSYAYEGIQDCAAASLLLGGPKGCKYGCLGFGTCVKSCNFGALTLSPEGLPVVNLDLCTGCGKCASTCPKQVIGMVPVGSPIRINCSSKDKGPQAKKLCSAACIGCGLCARNCPYGAVKVENNLAVVDSSICIEKCNDALCLVKCPTGAIRPVVGGIVPGTESREAAAAICTSLNAEQESAS